MSARIARGLVLISVATLAGCGGDDDGGPMGTIELEADWPVPASWEAGAAFGMVLLSDREKLPSSLTSKQCTLTAQLARATAAGMLPRTDEEGACIVTAATSLSGLEPDPAPACAGVFRFTYGGAARSIFACDPAMFAPTVDVDCAELTAQPSIDVASSAGEETGDELVSYTANALRPQEPAITAPPPQGDGTTLWPDGSLTIGWVAGAASGVEIVVSPTTDTTAPVVRCLVADNGSFTVPARLVDSMRGSVTAVEVARLSQQRATYDGFDLRTTFRTSTVVWMFPP